MTLMCSEAATKSCSNKRGVLRNFTKFTGKHLCQSFFLNKRLWQRCFPENFSKFRRTPFLKNTSGGCFSVLMLLIYYYFKMFLTHQVFHVQVILPLILKSGTELLSSRDFWASNFQRLLKASIFKEELISFTSWQK